MDRDFSRSRSRSRSKSEDKRAAKMLDFLEISAVNFDTPSSLGVVRTFTFSLLYFKPILNGAKMLCMYDLKKNI